MFSNQVHEKSNNSKRKALELITNIFRKKSKDADKEFQKKNFPPTVVNSNHHQMLPPQPPIISVPFQVIKKSSPDYGIPPHSPISSRVKNLDHDIEALTLSRQDNPFITSRLEKLSSSGELSPANLTADFFSNDAKNYELYHNHSLIAMDIDEKFDNSNVHEHLIRSPPPQFPQKLSHFVFPFSNSPIRSISFKNSNLLYSTKSNSLNLCSDPSIQIKHSSASSGLSYHNTSVIVDPSEKINLGRSGSETSIHYSKEYSVNLNESNFYTSQSSSDLYIPSPTHSPRPNKNHSFGDFKLERDLSLSWIIDHRCESTLSSSREALISNASSTDNLTN